MTLNLSYSFFKKHNRLLTMAILLLFTVNGQAEQVSFNKKKVDNGYSFQYQWLDHNARAQSINFSLNQKGLFERFRNFKTYQSRYAQKAILRRIKKHMMRNPISGVQIVYRQQQDKFFIEAKGLDTNKVAKAYQTITTIENKITNEYLKDSYYQPFIDHQHNSGIKVDHVSIANDSVGDLKSLKPIILNHVSIQNIREVTNYVLAFIQSIPYNTLESRITSSGAGFSPPLKVLWENQGDCDSKMALTAALLRALMPRIEMVLIYIDGHAFIGINIPGQGKEVSIEHNNVRYLLADPTGPALLPLGALSPESELAINQGHYVAEDYHEVSQ